MKEVKCVCRCSKYLVLQGQAVVQIMRKEFFLDEYFLV